MKFRFAKMLRDQLYKKFPEKDKKILLGLAIMVTWGADKNLLEVTFNKLIGHKLPDIKFSEEKMIEILSKGYFDLAEEKILNNSYMVNIEKTLTDIYDEVLAEIHINKKKDRPNFHAIFIEHTLQCTYCFRKYATTREQKRK